MAIENIAINQNIEISPNPKGMLYYSFEMPVYFLLAVKPREGTLRLVVVKFS
jgi:hypothetical protein